MYKITYRDLKTNHTRTFIILADSLIGADGKLRNVYREELRASIITKYTRCKNQPVTNIQLSESQVLSGSNIQLTSPTTDKKPS